MRRVTKRPLNTTMNVFLLALLVISVCVATIAPFAWLVMLVAGACGWHISYFLAVGLTVLATIIMDWFD